MNDAILLMYSVMGFVTIGAYPFSIRKMLQEEGGDSHIGSWAIWFLSSVIGCLYAAYVVGDLPLTLLNSGHLLGTGSILLIQIRKKRKNKEKTLLG